MKTFPQLSRPRILNVPLFLAKSQKSQREPPASLGCHIDSSPTIVLNHNHSGDDSVVSGFLLLHATEDGIQVENLHAVVRIHVTYKKPFKKGCKSCKHQTTELKRCQLITTAITLDHGIYSYPFSYRIPSRTPPTMDTSILSFVYKFEAIASVRRQSPISHPSEIITSGRTLQVARSMPVPNSRSISNRIYQVDGIEVSCSFNSVMSPAGKNKAVLTLSGLRSCPGSGEDVQFWRVCRGTWILEETIKTTALACTEHAKGSGEERNTIREKKKALGESSFYDGWTTDDQAGTLSMEFPFSTRRRSTKYTQDTGDCGDASITHALVLELQLMREIYPKGKPDLSVRTGVGRILRSEHQVVFSNHVRLSDSANVHEESLPCYHDLWPRPPIYKEGQAE